MFIIEMATTSCDPHLGPFFLTKLLHNSKNYQRFNIPQNLLEPRNCFELCQRLEDVSDWTDSENLHQGVSFLKTV